MTQDPKDQTDQTTDPASGFGDASAPDVDAASAASTSGPGAAGETISGVDNWLEEGGPLEPGDVEAGDEVAVLRTQLAERTLDLQRLQAEYVNYKRRVDRDRDLVKQNAVYTALTPIIDVLDTVDRARQHGELDGGFKSVADQLERVVAAQGLVKFGQAGEPFDPTVHEALSSIGPDAEVSVTSVKDVARSGYKIGERVVRAAQVITVEPGPVG